MRIFFLSVGDIARRKRWRGIVQWSFSASSSTSTSYVKIFRARSLISWLISTSLVIFLSTVTQVIRYFRNIINFKPYDAHEHILTRAQVTASKRICSLTEKQYRREKENKDRVESCGKFKVLKNFASSRIKKMNSNRISG